MTPELIGIVNTALNGLLLVAGVPILVRVARTVTAIATRFERLEVAVIGHDGKGGAVSEVAKLRDFRHEEYAPRTQRIEARLAVVEHVLKLNTEV